MEFAASSADFFVFPSPPTMDTATDMATDDRTSVGFFFLDDSALPTISPEWDFLDQLCMSASPAQTSTASTASTASTLQSNLQSPPPACVPVSISRTEPSPPSWSTSAPRCIASTSQSRPGGQSLDPPGHVTPCSPQSPPVHTYFPDLRKMVASDCQPMSLPSLLFQSVTSSSSSSMDVGAREMVLLARLRRLESSGGTQVKELSALFRSHSAGIEMERMQVLYQATTPHYRDWLDVHFDQERHLTMDRVERSLLLLELKTESDRDAVSGARRRTPLSRRAVKLMENWYDGHRDHPYPSATVVEAMSRSGALTAEQVRKWFANRRIRRSNTKSLTEIAKRNHHDKFGVMSRGVVREQY